MMLPPPVPARPNAGVQDPDFRELLEVLRRFNARGTLLDVITRDGTGTFEYEVGGATEEVDGYFIPAGKQTIADCRAGIRPYFNGEEWKLSVDVVDECLEDVPP